MLAKGVVDVLIRFGPWLLLGLEVVQVVETERARREVKKIGGEVKRLEGIVVGIDSRVSQLDDELQILRSFNVDPSSSCD